MPGAFIPEKMERDARKLLRRRLTPEEVAIYLGLRLATVKAVGRAGGQLRVRSLPRRQHYRVLRLLRRPPSVRVVADILGLARATVGKIAQGRRRGPVVASDEIRFRSVEPYWCRHHGWVRFLPCVACTAEGGRRTGDG
jgi:hypothetical protein